MYHALEGSLKKNGKKEKKAEMVLVQHINIFNQTTWKCMSALTDNGQLLSA